MINNKKNTITVFEHESLRTDRGERLLPYEALLSLQKFYGEQGVPYYSLIHNGVKFNEYVGVLQVGNYVIEVLPKADSNNSENEWRNMLLNMLKTVGVFDIQAPSSSSLNVKQNSILDLYFSLFINETEQLLHNGLIKSYHKIESNKSTLKGSIVFQKHITHNIVHKERFYNRYTTYDTIHPLNKVLYKTLILLKRINSNSENTSRIGALLLNFPEMPNINTDEAFFDNIVYNRKNEQYKNAIQIARLLLLNYHPDITNGKSDVLALMFDMNLLWEQFVYVSLRKHINIYFENSTISAQTKFKFWKPENGYTMNLKPDIVIKKNDGSFLVLDTKWKNLGNFKPSPDDLRQMYTYSKYHKNATTALLFPGKKRVSKSTFIDGDLSCTLYSIPVTKDIKEWQYNIANFILNN